MDCLKLFSLFFLVNIKYILILVCFPFFLLWGFKIDHSQSYPTESKNFEKVIISKITQRMYFFLGNKVDFLSPGHMRLWASSP